MVRRELIEIRFHKAFSDQKVKQIVESLVARPELACLSGCRVMYQGRELIARRAVGE
jgi:hypothetical protein